MTKQTSNKFSPEVRARAVKSPRVTDWSAQVSEKQSMKIFISWSGDRSKKVASALKMWLRDVFQGIPIQALMSDQNILAGARWESELEKMLNECKLGIICLTPESLQSPWLTFEAGALSTAITGSRVIPYRFELRSADLGPPLSQFQDVSADEQGTFKLVQSINDACGSPIKEEERLKRTFDHWWLDLDQQLMKIQHKKEAQIRTDREVLEEMLDLIRQTGIRGLSSILNQLLQIKNVRRIEVAKKEVADTVTNTLSLRITVLKKLPIDQIKKEEMIPKSIFGMPTDVVEGT